MGNGDADSAPGKEAVLSFLPSAQLWGVVCRGPQRKDGRLKISIKKRAKTTVVSGRMRKIPAGHENCFDIFGSSSSVVTWSFMKTASLEAQ